MNVKRRICFLMAIAILSATASLAEQIKTDYDRNADFSRYKTYSWGNVHTQDPLWVDRIKEAVNSALAASLLELLRADRLDRPLRLQAPYSARPIPD